MRKKKQNGKANERTFIDVFGERVAYGDFDPDAYTMTEAEIRLSQTPYEDIIAARNAAQPDEAEKPDAAQLARLYRPWEVPYHLKPMDLTNIDLDAPIPVYDLPADEEA